MNNTKPPPKPDETVILIWHIPTESKTRFKEVCAADGITMREAILKLMNGFCNGWFDITKPPIPGTYATRHR